MHSPPCSPGDTPGIIDARRAAVRLSAVGLWTWDYASATHWWSAEAFQVTGRDPALGPLPFTELRRRFCAASIEDIDAGVAHMLATGEACEVGAQSADDPPRWFLLRVDALRDAAGNVTGLYGTLQDISACKRLELALREKERRLSRVLAGADQGFWDWNLASGEFTVSPRFETMLGYQPGEMTLDVARWGDYVYPDDLARALASIDAHLAGQTDCHEVELRCRTRCGAWRWMLTCGRVVEWDADGRPLIMSGTHTDITRRKHAEIERAESERRFRLTHSIVPVAIAQQDALLRYTSLSGPTIAHTIEEIVGRRDADLFCAADAEKLTSIKRRVLASGTGERHEVSIDLAGQRRWFDLIVEPEPGADGSPVGVICASADITERKEREEAYRTVLADQTELIARYRPDGAMTFANATYCQFFGKAENEIVGKTWHPAAHPEDIAMIEAKLATLTPDSPVVTIENRVFDARGQERWMQFVNRGFFDPGGRIRELQSVGRDVTERRRLEADLVAHRGEIVRLLEENDQLREQQRKEIAREIHDQIGSQLAVVRMRLESMSRSEAIEPQLRDALQQVERSVAQTLAIARRICTDLRPPALDDIGLVETCRWHLGEWGKHVGMRVALRASAVPAHLPEQLSIDLFRAFQELLTNVTKHSGATRVCVVLALKADGLTLRVRDNGQGHGADVDATTGGLGLIGIRERVARHDGQFTTSRSEAGFTATLWIPRTRCVP